MKTPLKISTCAVVLNAVLNVLAVVGLPQEWRHVGLAGSTVVCAGLSCLWLGLAAVRRNGELGFAHLVRPVAHILIAAGVMGGVLVGVRPLVGPRPLLALALLIPAGGIVYLAAGWPLLKRRRAR